MIEIYTIKKKKKKKTDTIFEFVRWDKRKDVQQTRAGRSLRNANSFFFDRPSKAGYEVQQVQARVSLSSLLSLWKKLAGKYGIERARYRGELRETVK